MSYHLQIPIEIIRDRNISPLSKICYSFLQFRSNNKGYCWASNSNISSELNISKANVSKMIKDLKNNNYIRIEHKRKGKSIEVRYIYPLINKEPQKKQEPLPTSTFNLFWDEYPVKKGKKAAEKSFIKANIGVDKLIKAIQDQSKERKLKKEAGDFVPEWKNPSTWLNQGCWEDVVEVSMTNQEKKERIKEIKAKVKSNEISHSELFMVIKEDIKHDYPSYITYSLLREHGRDSEAIDNYQESYENEKNIKSQKENDKLLQALNS